MFDPNVPSFFLIILCGFGAVYAFRMATKKEKTLGDFEYLAFSTIWGSVIFLPIAYRLDKQNLLSGLTQLPFIATPELFISGFLLGWVVGFVIRKFKK